MSKESRSNLAFGWEVKLSVDEGGHLNILVENEEGDISEVSSSTLGGEYRQELTFSLLEEKESQYFASIHIYTDGDVDICYENEWDSWVFNKVLVASTLEELYTKILSIECSQRKKATDFVEDKIKEFVEEHKKNNNFSQHWSGNQVISMFISKSNS